jgi:hypothetical protein
MRLFWTTAVIAVASNLLFIMLGRGSIKHVVFAFATASYIGIPAALVAVIAFAFRRRLSVGKRVATLAAATALAALSVLVSIPIGAAVLNRDIHNAEAYCEALVPELEQYRQRHGQYPRRLPPGVVVGNVPRLLRNWPFYSSDGSQFYFSIIDPSGMLNSFKYNSGTRQWSKAD